MDPEAVTAMRAKPKRKYTWRMDPAEVSAIRKRPKTRRKDPAEVSASYRAAVNRLVEYEGEMIPVIEKLRRINGRNSCKLRLTCCSLLLQC
jgi:hypothetical protein